MSVFKSFKPRRYFTVIQYNKRFNITYLDDPYSANEVWLGHMFKEKCANCSKSFGEHYKNKCP